MEHREGLDVLLAIKHALLAQKCTNTTKKEPPRRAKPAFRAVVGAFFDTQTPHMWKRDAA